MIALYCLYFFMQLRMLFCWIHQNPFVWYIGTHYSPLHHFYISWKRRKTFWRFQRVCKLKRWTKVGSCLPNMLVTVEGEKQLHAQISIPGRIKLLDCVLCCIKFCEPFCEIRSLRVDYVFNVFVYFYSG